jgi:hypothetical protein
MKTLELHLQLAGMLQFFILIASALVPRIFDWRRNLAPLPPFLRTLFWVYGTFIVLIIIGFGTLTLLHAQAMAAGEPVARSLCVLIAFFWIARLAVQWCVFDVRPFLVNRWLATGYQGLTIAFLYLSVVYGWAAIAPSTVRFL